MRILLTGHEGYIGAVMAPMLQAAGHEVVGLDVRALGHDSIHRFHLNEGHAALAVLALIDEQVGGRDAEEKEILAAFEDLRSRCVFTTHTPVAAGHDQFTVEMVRVVLGKRRTRWPWWRRTRST